jgi:hypothetical protein
MMSVCSSVCLSDCLSFCLYIHLFIYLSVCPSVSLFVCPSNYLFYNEFKSIPTVISILRLNPTVKITTVCCSTNIISLLSTLLTVSLGFVNVSIKVEAA